MFKLNKKNLGLEKLLSRDNPRLRHLHVSGRGLDYRTAVLLVQGVAAESVRDVAAVSAAG